MATPPTRVLSAAPSSNWGQGTSKVSTSFDVQAGDLLVVKCSTADGSSPSTVTPSASGGSVTWTSRASQSLNTSQQNSGFLWSGDVGATATGITITLARPSTGNVYWGFTVEVWRNLGGVGVVFQGNNGTGSSAPSVTATVSANSAVTCQVSDWNAVDGATRTWRTINGSPETESLYFRNSTQYTLFGGYCADVGAGGSVTQGLTAPSNLRWVLTGIEILGTTGGTGDATVSAVTATATSAASTPGVTTDYSAAGEVATATSQAPVPTVSVDYTVAGEVATATVAALVPSVTADSVVTATTATATSGAQIPSIRVDYTAAGVVATATATAPAPAVTVDASVQAALATATAGAQAPTVDVSGSAAVAPPTATASAASQAPSVAAGASLAAVTATASASASVPSVFVDALVAAATATAAVDAPAPTFVVPDATVFADVANAWIDVLAPAVSATGFVYTFRLPVFGMHYRSKEEPIIVRIAFPTAYSVLKTNGFYQQMQTPTDEQIEAAEVAYLGGHDYRLTDSEYDSLVAAGYGAYITVSME